MQVNESPFGYVMLNRPFRSVLADFETFPENDVALTVTPLTGVESGPVTRPRITSNCCAMAGWVMTTARRAHTSKAIRRMFTAR